MPWLAGQLLGFLTQGGCKCILLVKWRLERIFVEQKGRLYWFLGLLTMHIFFSSSFWVRGWFILWLLLVDRAISTFLSNELIVGMLWIIFGLCILILIQGSQEQLLCLCRMTPRVQDSGCLISLDPEALRWAESLVNPTAMKHEEERNHGCA